jgi:hypothetical protein
MSVDPEDPQKIYAGTEHSGLFYSTDGGAHWHRAEPQVPKCFFTRHWRSTAGDGRHDPLGGLPQQERRLGRTGRRATAQRRGQFPPSPELQSRTRYLAYDPDTTIAFTPVSKSAAWC